MTQHKNRKILITRRLTDLIRARLGHINYTKKYFILIAHNYWLIIELTFDSMSGLGQVNVEQDG